MLISLFWSSLHEQQIFITCDLNKYTPRGHTSQTLFKVFSTTLAISIIFSQRAYRKGTL